MGVGAVSATTSQAEQAASACVLQASGVTCPASRWAHRTARRILQEADGSGVLTKSDAV